MIVRPDEKRLLENSIYLRGAWEAGTLDVLTKTLRPGDTFVDIGANAGVMSLHAARLVGEKGRIFSFEPPPKLSVY